MSFWSHFAFWRKAPAPVVPVPVFAPPSWASYLAQPVVPPVSNIIPLPVAAFGLPDNPNFPRDPNQAVPAEGDNSRKWYATNSVGGGYYYTVAGTEKPLPNIHDTANPYVTPGLWAVIKQVGTPLQVSKAWGHLLLASGNDPMKANDVVNANADADPLWNVALQQLVGVNGQPGKTPAEAFAIASQGPVKPTFTVDQVTVALQVFYSL